MMIVADIHTAKALGSTLAALLRTHICVLPSGVKASVEAAEYVAAQACYRRIIAVGSGTINDICKYAAFLNGTSYVCVPTALSMNGYASAGASLTNARGLKQSLPCDPPNEIIFMPAVSAGAPSRMIRAGLCDTLCYVSCIQDMKLASYVVGAAYDDTPFHMQRPAAAAVLSQPDVYHVAPSEHTLMLIMRWLVLSGHAMRIAKSSAPASQSEHMLCHAYDTAFSRNTYLHGEKTGAFARWTLRWQEHILQALSTGDLMQQRFSAGYHATLRKRLPDAVRTPVSGKAAVSIYRSKQARAIRSVSYDMISDDMHDTDRRAKHALERLAPARLPIRADLIMKQPVFLTRDRFTVLDIMETCCLRA